MAGTWGGARPNSGRKRSMSPAAKAERRARIAGRAPLVAQQQARAPSIEDIAEIIRQSNARRGAATHDQQFNPFQLPVFPPAAMPPANMRMAMDQVPACTWAGDQWTAGYFNSVAAEGLLFPGYAYLSELAQRPEYRTFAETIATEATRKWIKFSTAQQAKAKREADEDSGREDVIGATDEDPEPDDGAESSDKQDNEKTEKIAELEDFLNDLKTRDHFATLSAQDTFFGRTHLSIDFGDIGDEELRTPIADPAGKFLEGKIGRNALKRLQVIEPVWTYPTTYNATNPLAFDWYNPQVWYVMGKQIHRSRLPCFVSRPVPDLLKPSYSFGGLSLTQMAKPYVDIWLTTRQSVGDLIHSFSVMVLMTDLATMTQPGGAGALLARVALFNTLRDNQGTFVVNKSTEDFKNVSASIAGLHELQAQAQEHMMSVARIPAVKFTGIQPTGLNASSEGEMRAFYDTIAAYQNRFFKPHLDYLIDIAQISLWGERDPDIVYEFESLWELTEKEKSEMRKADADTGKILIDSGVISPEEERKRLAGDPDGLYHDIDPEDVPDLKQEEEQGLQPGKGGQQGGGGFGGGNGQGAAEDGAIPFGVDEWSEADHPRGQPENAGQFGAGGGGSAAKGAKAPKPQAGKETAPAATAASGEGDQPEYKTKKEHAAALLEKGTTAGALMKALGWPSVSMPATAKSIGMNLEKTKVDGVTVYKGTWMTPEERKASGLMPEGVRRSGGPKSRDQATWSLMEAIVDRGGIDPKDPLIGDVRAVLGTKNKFIPGFGQLIRAGGQRLDRMRESMVEAGYLDDAGNRTDGLAQSTITHLLDALDRENRGDRVYIAGNTPEHVQAAERAEIAEENQRHFDEQLDDAMQQAGLDPAAVDEKQRGRIVQIMQKEGVTDPLEAIEREAMEWVNNASERGEAERILDDIPGWDVPDDAGAAPKPSGSAAPF